MKPKKRKKKQKIKSFFMEYNPKCRQMAVCGQKWHKKSA
jgi:hypothetical protein